MNNLKISLLELLEIFEVFAPGLGLRLSKFLVPLLLLLLLLLD
jgi:hypothetical protein